MVFIQFPFSSASFYKQQEEAGQHLQHLLDSWLPLELATVSITEVSVFCDLILDVVFVI